jgi:hypothetical protein
MDPDYADRLECPVYAVGISEKGNHGGIPKEDEGSANLGKMVGLSGLIEQLSMDAMGDDNQRKASNPHRRL